MLSKIEISKENKNVNRDSRVLQLGDRMRLSVFQNLPVRDISVCETYWQKKGNKAHKPQRHNLQAESVETNVMVLQEIKN